MEEPVYTLRENIRSGKKYTVYKVLEESSGMAYVLKTLNDSSNTATAEKKLQTEFDILQKFHSPLIVKASGIKYLNGHVGIVRRYLEGCSLDEYSKKSIIDFEFFFQAAFQLAEALKIIHSKHVIHKNICPSNIIVNPANGQITVIGFSLAAEQGREALIPRVNEAFEADLSYISPEQTGRINRTLDYRSDLYSLGAVFVTLLTGHPPFAAKDPLELIHCHIAITPPTVKSIRPEIPVQVSQIIAKLLAKNKDARYQSAAGLLFDLQQADEMYQAASTEPLLLGLKDISEQFIIPAKLYGRSEEVAQLQHAVSAVQQGGIQLVMVSGSPGVGKSTLVKQAQQFAGQHKSYFIAGKFDQFKKDVPLSALVASLQQLIRQLLAEPAKQIEQWRSTILEAVGNAGRIITDLVPEAEMLLGTQPELPELAPLETKNRFNQVFNQFINLFCQPEHPLYIFLDDLQWVDSATRQWMEDIFTEQPFGYFMLIGAYRSNEVTASHPLALMTGRLKNIGTGITWVNLEPLSQQNLNAMVADTLCTGVNNCRDISETVYNKTLGNPFFARQCLLSLYENEAIFFKEEEREWAYDIGSVQKVKISDNVVELMADLILQLPAEIQNTLKLAACIGSRFDIPTLSIVSETVADVIYDQLATAIQKGVIVPLQLWQKEGYEEYSFLHDRVHQAALSLMAENEKKVARLTIGKLIMEESKSLEAEVRIYDIADHLNYADGLITDDAPLMQLASVNFIAATKAKNSSAYQPALSYVIKAISTIDRLQTTASQEMIKNVLLLRADVEHMCGNNAEAEKYYEQALPYANDVFSKALVQQRKIYYYINLGKFEEAYKTGRETVKLLGVSLPAKFIPPVFVKELIKNRFLMGRRKISGIATMPEMTDERIKAAVLLMSSFARAAYQIKPELCISVCTVIVNLSLQYGNTEGGYTGFIAFGPIFLGAILNKKQTGYDYGQLALALVEKYKSTAYKAEINFVAGYFAVPWRKPAAEMERYWQTAYDAGLEAGDLFHASCACCATVQSHYMRGKNLDEILATANQYAVFLQRIHNNEGLLTLKAVSFAVNELKYGNVEASRMSVAEDKEYTDKLKLFGSRHFAHYYYINKMQVLYLRGEFENAYAISIESDRFLKDSPGMLHTAEHYFYKALIICAILPTVTTAKRYKLKTQLAKINARFKRYATGCPDNFIHKSQLINAELCRVENNVQQAEDFYYQSIESALKYGYQNISALTHELAARFHSSRGRTHIAAQHLSEAVTAYNSWGAAGYADSLPRKYTGKISTGSIQPGIRYKPTGTDNLIAQNQDSALDLKTVLKSSEAISREIRLRDLLSSLMKIIMESAGAQRMVLLLMDGGAPKVQAESVAESGSIEMFDHLPLEQFTNIPQSIAYYVARTTELVIIEDAAAYTEFSNDAFIKENNTRSIVCAPLIKQGKLTGIIYLENNLVTAAFTQSRVELLLLLSGQMAISIENALLYDNLEEKVTERTEQLHKKNEELEQTLGKLKDSQRKLIHAEKMASLGQMASGIAHEIQNPLNFVNNFSELSAELIPDVRSFWQKMQQNGFASENEDIGDILDDLENNIRKIGSHGKRASDIVKGVLLQTSGLSEIAQEAHLKKIIELGIEQAKKNFAIKGLPAQVGYTIDYDESIDNINCLPKSLVTVVANVTDNALYALYEKQVKNDNGFTPQLSVTVKPNGGNVDIQIADNGSGIPKNILDKIFIPFFTTKPTGKGNTGNGLSQCHQIIADGHNGAIEVVSEEGRFTQFTITIPK